MDFALKVKWRTTTNKQSNKKIILKYKKMDFVLKVKWLTINFYKNITNFLCTVDAA